MNRWRIGIVLFILALSVDHISAQTPQYSFRVSFTDKNGSPALGNPLVFLSQKALDRRTKYGIAVDNSDRPVSSVYLDSVVKLTQGKLKVTSRWFNQCVLLLDDSTKILQLQGLTFVNNIRQVGYYATGLHRQTGGGKEKFSEEQIVPEPYFALRTTGSATYYGEAWPQTKLVNGDVLHDHGWRGKGVRIAVLDAGFMNFDTHPGCDSVRMGGRLLDRWNFIKGNDSVYKISEHGQQCGSAIYGTMPGTYIGAAPDASFALYITEDAVNNFGSGYDQEAEMDNLVAGIERCDSLGIDIISCSLGYRDMGFPADAFLHDSDLNGIKTIAARGVNTATAKGILFIASAGNDDISLLTPGDADSAITIGATDIAKNTSGITGSGPNYRGVVKPDVGTLGAPAKVFSSNGIAPLSGTSFAVPQIAGWAACLLQAKPNAKPYEIHRAINMSAHLYPHPGPKTGYGVPDFRMAAIIMGLIDTSVSSAQDSLAVMPNAFNDNSTVKMLLELKQDEQVQVALYDMAGRCAWYSEASFTAGKRTIDLDLPRRLPAGMYVLKAVTKNTNYTTKMVKY